MKVIQAAAALAFALAPFAASAQNYPAPQQHTWVAKDFKFHTGEVMPELRVGYTTVGQPSGQPVLILHGTTGSASSMLTPAFAGQLFGPGQPLDASKYFIIIPDLVGNGRSSKPSDGLKTKFPHYNYDDMVDAQYRLVTEGLGIRHLRLVIGNSMGGMHTWIWGTRYPDAMDALVPMASQPTEMSSRNWMMRRLLIETIRNDPGLQRRQLHRAAALHENRQRVLRHRHQRRNAGLSEARADARAGRQAGRRAPGGAVPRRCQRLHLRLGVVARLQPGAGARADHRAAARHQCRRRRAQPAGDRADGECAQAREERPSAADPGERRHARPRHHRQWRDSTSSSSKSGCAPCRSGRCKSAPCVFCTRRLALGPRTGDERAELELMLESAVGTEDFPVVGQIGLRDRHMIASMFPTTIRLASARPQGAAR